MPPTALKMPQVASPEETKYQHELQLEKEANKLRREYVILDRERQLQYVHNVQNCKMAKQQKVIKIFGKEHLEILTDLKVATDPGKIRQDSIQFRQLNNVLDELDVYTEDVEVQKKYLKEIDQQIGKIEKNVMILRQQQQQMSENQHVDYVRAAEKTIEKLDNRLEVQMIKFSMITAENKKLRDEIDHLLWDRRNFMTMWQKFIDKLSSGKRIMLDLIEQATIAYDQRDDWCSKLQLLRMGGYRDMIVNVELMRRYKQKCDNTRKLEEYFSIKGQKRVMKDLIERQKLKRLETEMKMQENLTKYREMMEEIYEFTKISQTEVLAKKYCAQESVNFTQFLFIVEKIREMESVNQKLTDLHIEVEERKIQHDAMAMQQQTNLENLEKELEKTTSAAKESEDDLSHLDGVLNNMMQSISHLFKICRCDQDPLLKLLGDNSQVKHYNVLLYLEILENRIQEGLVKVMYKNNMDKKLSKKRAFSVDFTCTKLYKVPRIVKKHPCSLCLTHEMVGDVFDSVQRPLSKEEAKEKLKQRLLLPNGDSHLHTISKCHLPQARRIMQQRYE